MFRKAVSLTLVLLCLLVMLAGCTTQINTPSTTAVATTTVATTATTTAATTTATAITTAVSAVTPTTAATTAPVVTDTPRYPIVSDPVTYSVLASHSSDTGHFEDTMLMQKYEELTGIHMDYQEVNATDFETKLNLLLASDSLTDWVYGDLLYDTLYKYGTKGGMFYEISGLLNEYMPNLVSWFEDLWFVKPGITMGDGTILGVPHFYSSYVDASGTYYLRTDMLDQIGIEIPTTLEEYASVLKAFKESTAFGNGFYPIEIRGTGVSAFLNGAYANWLFPSFGTATTTSFADAGTRKVVYNYISDQYRDYLAFTANCFKEGYFDPEVFTMDYATAVAKIKENKCAFTTGATSLGVENFASGNVDCVILAPLTSEYNTAPTLINQGWGINISGAISSKCENAGVLLRWMDIGYTREFNIDGSGIGIGSYEYGLYGYNFEWTDEDLSGINTWIPDEWKSKVGDMSDQDFRRTYMAPYFRISANYGYIINYSDPSQTMKATQTMLNIIPYMEAKSFPDSLLRMTEDEQEDYTNMLTDINTYVENEVAKFITGIRSMDDWGKFVEEINNMGIDDVLSIKQAAYDRYLEING